MPRIFISYRRDDSSYAALHLYERLASRFGRDNVFFDVESIPFGIDFRRDLSDAVGWCDVLLAVIGDGWLTATNADGERRLDDPADYVRIEIQTGLDRDILVIPVLVRRATMPRKLDLPVGLNDFAYRNAAELRPGRDFIDDVDRLIRRLEYLDRQIHAQAEQARCDLDQQMVANLEKQQCTPSVRSWFEALLGGWNQDARRPAESTAGQVRRFTLAPDLEMDFAYIPAGTVQLGSPTTEVGRFKDEVLHNVTLTKSFYLGMYPVTVSEFNHFVTATKYQPEGWNKTPTWRNPGFAQTARHPVVCISWNDAMAMVLWLNQTRDDSGLVYALPTEAQWEYACRAGSRKAYFFGDDVARLDAHAWFYNNMELGTSPVETKKPNPWSLWHMHGLVLEWCNDWYGDYPSTIVQNPTGPPNGSYRVCRGGHWGNPARFCRAANRCRSTPDDTGSNLGLRLARIPVQ